ncbi:hypothetical protein AB4304_13970 [Vibrio breoganii]
MAISHSDFPNTDLGHMASLRSELVMLVNSAVKGTHNESTETEIMGLFTAADTLLDKQGSVSATDFPRSSKMIVTHTRRELASLVNTFKKKANLDDVKVYFTTAGDLYVSEASKNL